MTFLGAQPHNVIQDEMRKARGFVQHSIEAPSGDSEGMPVSIIEAGVSGLPVVATRHAGIPDARLWSIIDRCMAGHQPMPASPRTAEGEFS